MGEFVLIETSLPIDNTEAVSGKKDSNRKGKFSLSGNMEI